jgi:hypothetical protein
MRRKHSTKLQLRLLSFFSRHFLFWLPYRKRENLIMNQYTKGRSEICLCANTSSSFFLGGCSYKNQSTTHVPGSFEGLEGPCCSISIPLNTHVQVHAHKTIIHLRYTMCCASSYFHNPTNLQVKTCQLKVTQLSSKSHSSGRQSHSKGSGIDIIRTHHVQAAHFTWI